MAYKEDEVKKIFDEIIGRISEGESLRAVLRSEHLPNGSTIYEWLAKDEGKAKQYARATKIRADVIFDEILEIADSQGKDIKVVDGEEVIDHNAIQRNRLQVDARKWALSKMNPKKYGEKVDVTSDGRELKVLGFLPEGFED